MSNEQIIPAVTAINPAVAQPAQPATITIAGSASTPDGTIINGAAAAATAPGDVAALAVTTPEGQVAAADTTTAQAATVPNATPEQPSAEVAIERAEDLLKVVTAIAVKQQELAQEVGKIKEQLTAKSAVTPQIESPAISTTTTAEAAVTQAAAPSQAEFLKSLLEKPVEAKPAAKSFALGA